jgi:magnesium chelatase family protein
MRAAVTDMGLSARAHDKILRVARTIADLESNESIETYHIEEAINYRMLDRDIFH